jgi:hypothetical protein
VGLREAWGRLLGERDEAQELVAPTRLAALVPCGATYVTVGAVRVVADVRALLGAAPGSRRLQSRVGPMPDVEPMAQALLVLDGERLRVINDREEIWSAEVTQITDLDAHQHSGFVVVTRRPDGLLVGFQQAARAHPGTEWCTVGRLTNAVSGWDAQLQPYGVRTHF